MISRINNRRDTSITSAINFFHHKNEGDVELVQENQAINQFDGFYLTIASDRNSYLDAANLAYKVYSEKGYVESKPLPFILNHWDLQDNCVCIVAYNDQHECVGTISVIKDFGELPLDITFHSELNEIRQKNISFCEISRFVVSPNFRNQKELLLRMFNFASIVAFRYYSVEKILIEVNPRHVSFYEKKFLFNICSECKSSPFVNDAPAVLLNVDSKYYIDLIKGKKLDIIKRTLWENFYEGEDDENLFQFIVKLIKSVSEDDLNFFYKIIKETELISA